MVNRTRQCWSDMKQRCFNQNAQQWNNYGGRGITVCDRWLSYSNFLSDMGEKPSDKTLDRIDNDGDYEPANCRWASKVEQRANQRTVHNVLLDGKLVPLRTAAKKYGIHEATFARRLRQGWTLEKVISTPINIVKSKAGLIGNSARWSNAIAAAPKEN